MAWERRVDDLQRRGSGGGAGVQGRRLTAATRQHFLTAIGRLSKQSRSVLWAAGCRRRRDPVLKAKRKAPHLSVQGCRVTGMWLRLDVHVLEIKLVDLVERIDVAIEGMVE